MKDLGQYLGVSDTSEDDLAAVEDARLPGTCEWFSAKMSYLRWRDSELDAPNILWINGKPAAGKSTLVGYAINQLRKQNAACSFFFFKYRDKSKSRLSACLRSLAFQMAVANKKIRNVLLDMRKNDTILEMDDERSIWRKLFLLGIFQIDFPKQYWMIDALDECENIGSFFDSMLAKMDESVPLRILMTSRMTSGLEKHFSNLGTHRFRSEGISTADTLPDIKFLVEAKARPLMPKDNENRANLVEKILGKSEGSFLWTVLVLNELSNTHGEEEMNQVLDEVPREMEPLYQRALESMSKATRGKRIAKAILIWTACATRPLTIKELHGALEIDLEDTFPKLEVSIVALCGQLVTVDKFGRVQMVHETAREFLLKEDLVSEFTINKKEAHTRIAKTCFMYLTGKEMKPPRSIRRGSAMITVGKRAEFSLYACTAFSYHVAKADPNANDLLILVDSFLKANVLSWIEVIAQTQNLSPLIRVARHLGKYLRSCTAVRSPLGRGMHMITGWSMDLIRIAAKFASALILSPSAIHSVILPFCPTESVVYKTSNPGRRLSVVGLSNTQWDDRMTCIDFRESQTSTVCHGDGFFAVGLTTGTVALYHAISCQEYKVLNHGEAVRVVHFKSKTDLMASCGLKSVKIWDIRSGEIIYDFQPPERIMGLAFEKNLLLAASYKNYLASWDLNDGSQQADRRWNDSGEPTNKPFGRPPSAISISVSHKMLAVAYSGRPITLWDLEADAYYGSCGKKLSGGETSTHPITALVFNPNPAIGLLAASYLDGELVLLDPFDDLELESFRVHCHTLAVSPDGRLLAGGAGFGIIQIYEFDTLKLLYRVKSSNFYIKQLAFSRDGLYLTDIRGSQCNVWKPAALLRDVLGDDSSEGTSTSFVDVVASDTKNKLSAIAVHPQGEQVICGKDDGSISLYDMRTGTQVRTLYSHKSLVRIITWWCQSEIIMSVDASNGIFAWKLNAQKDGWVAEKILLQSRLDCGNSITQVLPGEAAGKFILSTRESDYLWSIDGQQQDSRTHSDRPGIRKWIQHQQSSLHMICVEGAVAYIYAWGDWSEIACITLATKVAGLQLKTVTPYLSGHGTFFILELSELNGSADTRHLHFVDGVAFTIGSDDNNRAALEEANAGRGYGTAPFTEDVTAISAPFVGPQLAILASYIAHVIGFSDTNKLVFLDKHSWVCSIDLESLEQGSISYSRHFFVPHDWFSGVRSIICAIVKREVLFARNEDIAIVKGGLEYSETVTIEVGAC